MFYKINHSIKLIMFVLLQSLQEGKIIHFYISMHKYVNVYIYIYKLLLKLILIIEVNHVIF